MEPDFSMRVVNTFIGEFGQVVSTRRETLNATIQGLAGDRHFGYSKKAGVRDKRFHESGTIIFNARQWSAVTVEELAEIAQAMEVPEIKAEWLGANLLLRNDSLAEKCDFTKLPELTRLVFEGGAVLIVYSENLPCRGPADAMLSAEPETFGEKAKFFGQVALGKRGLVGWVEKAGIIRPNETVRIHLPK